MPLSNAERQRRYREKLKARATGASEVPVVELARIAVERGIQALWAYHERPGPSGMDWGQIDGCRTIDEYRSELERSPTNLLQACRAFEPDFTGLTLPEARAVADVIEIADALRLTAPGRIVLPKDG